MQKIINITVSPKQASDEKYYKSIAVEHLNINAEEITGIEILKKSIDARGKYVKINLQLNVWWNEAFIKDEFKLDLKNVSAKPDVIIVGSWPAGLFAALKLIENICLK